MTENLHPGDLRTRSWWREPDVNCIGCKKKVTKWTGITCGNYCFARGQFPPCQMGWHGKCYEQRSADHYPRPQIPESERDEEQDPRDAKMFTHSRDGDNFLVPFQCDICHFRNMFLRDTDTENSPDHAALVAIRRANLDAFWARATTTVNGTKNHLRLFYQTGCHVYGLPSTLPEMGPFALRDDSGMRVAIITLHQSLRPGVYTSNLQFTSARKYRSAFTNVWGASQHSMNQAVMARDTVKTFVTSCPTSGLWYERTTMGMHARMGDDRRPDIAISTGVMLKMMEVLEEAYFFATEIGEQRYIARAGLFFLAAFLASLRGEEVPRLVRSHFIELNKVSMNELGEEHAVLPLYGRFKGENGVARCHLMRVSLETKSGFDIGKWIGRVSRFERNSNNKFLFSNAAGRKESMNDYSEIFTRTLEEVRMRAPHLILASINIE